MRIRKHTNSNNSPYKFNGKELDDETGNYYYGARYYNPKWSFWLSVDPLAEDYPEWSPYNYTLNNPIRFIDPDGRSVENFGCDDPPCWFETTLNAIKSTEITSIGLGAGVGTRIMDTGGAVSLINFSYDFKEETFSFKAAEGFIGLGIPGHSINAEADIAYSAKKFKDETAEGGFIRLSGNTEWEDNKGNGSVSLFAKSHQGEKGALIFDGNNTKSSEREFANPDVNFSGKIKAIFGVGFSFDTKKFKQLQEKSKAEAKQSKNQTLPWGEIKQLPPKRR